MSDLPNLRVSDQDRERAAQEIREHFAAGRLTEDELDERVEAAFSAQTQGQLNEIRRDLPRLPASRARQKAELAERRRGLRNRLVQEAGGGVACFAVCAVLWGVNGAHGFFWPLWVGLVCLLPLVRSGWMLYGPAPDPARVERELESRGRRRELHQARHEVRDARRAERRRR